MIHIVIFLSFSFSSAFYQSFNVFLSGSIGVRVKIMLPYDPKGLQGPSIQQADVVKVLEPKEDY